MAKARRDKRHTIDPADLERLQVATGVTAVDPTRSLLGPGTVTWRVNREAVLLAGGGCALMLQVAHPLVAAGVARYSNFRRDPLQRLYRTLDLMLTITFSPAAEAIAAVREIERRHARVHGKLEAAVGSYAAGTSYDANDPDLLLWVHATLVDTSVRVYEMFVGTLSDADRKEYYEESKVVGRVLGIPDAVLPANLPAFQRYMQAMVGGDRLAVSPAGREIAASIQEPDRPFGLKYVMPPFNLLTTGLLPKAVRTHYGYEWSATRETLLRTLVTATQLVLPLLPDRLRFFPHAYRAWAREGVRRPKSERQSAGAAA
jgi:uncharacterized protein (DUF2236 family)